MTNCLTCGRLACEPGEVVGYAGPLCQCIVEPKIQRLSTDKPVEPGRECKLCGRGLYSDEVKFCAACYRKAGVEPDPAPRAGLIRTDALLPLDFPQVYSEFIHVIEKSAFDAVVKSREKELQESQDHLADSQCDREKLQAELTEAKALAHITDESSYRAFAKRIQAENTDLLQKFNDAWDSYQNALGKLSEAQAENAELRQCNIKGDEVCYACVETCRQLTAARDELEQQRQWIVDRCSERDFALARVKELEKAYDDLRVDKASCCVANEERVKVLESALQTLKTRWDKVDAQKTTSYAIVEQALGETSCEPKSSGNPDSAPP